MTEAFPSLNGELDRLSQDLVQKMGQEAMDTFAKQIRELQRTDIEQRAPKVGDVLPPFELVDIATGAETKSADLLRAGGIVIAFYRGQWCPYCNLELRALEKAAPAIAAKGYTIVAISPQTVDQASTMRTEAGLSRTVQLRDAGNAYARQLGLVFDLGAEVTALYARLGITSTKYFGHDGSFELPVPATLVVNSKGVITYAFAKADYTKRAEPNALLAAININGN